MAKLDIYPTSRVENLFLFSRLAGGTFFTKLDLSQAYLQLLLEDGSKRLLLYIHTRACFNKIGFSTVSP